MSSLFIVCFDRCALIMNDQAMPLKQERLAWAYTGTEEEEEEENTENAGYAILFWFCFKVAVLATGTMSGICSDQYSQLCLIKERSDEQVLTKERGRTERGFTACLHSDMIRKQWFGLQREPKEGLWSLSLACFKINNIACPLRTNMEKRIRTWTWDDVLFFFFSPFYYVLFRLTPDYTCCCRYEAEISLRGWLEAKQVMWCT